MMQSWFPYELIQRITTCLSLQLAYGKDECIDVGKSAIGFSIATMYTVLCHGDGITWTKIVIKYER